MVDVSVEWTVVVAQVLLYDLGELVPVVGGLVAGSCTDGNVELSLAIDREATFVTHLGSRLVTGGNALEFIAIVERKRTKASDIAAKGQFLQLSAFFKGTVANCSDSVRYNDSGQSHAGTESVAADC